MYTIVEIVFTTWDVWEVYVDIENIGRAELNFKTKPSEIEIQAAVEQYIAAVATDEVETVEVEAENGEVV